MSFRFKKILLLMLAALFLAAGTAAAKPDKYPFPDMVPDRDNPRPDRGPFLYEPYAPTYEERLELAMKHTAETRSGSIEAAVSGARTGATAPLSEKTIEYIENRLGERRDCADFTAIRVMMLLWVNKKYDFLPPEQFERIKRTVLDFKYWVTEPGPDTMISWTENHQILFHANEYLAGQIFPDEIFTNNGQTGAWHQAHAKPFIMKWMERRSRWGFSEWDSNVYYNEDLGGVLALAQFANDPDVAAASAIVADLMVFDIASDLFHGIYGTSHGRTYAKDVLTGRDDDMGDFINVVFGLNVFEGAGSMAAMALAAGDRYRPSEVLIRIGQEDPPGFLSRERHGIPLEKFEQYGIMYDSLEDLPTMFGMGAYSQAQVVDTVVKFSDMYNLWKHPFFDEVGEYAQSLPRDGSLGEFRKNLEIEVDRTLLGEANKITYRTPNYMLSSAQSYRPGERGNQHHIWQATLSPEAIVFTTNPGSEELHGERTPCYWGGQNRLPRVAQYKNLAFILYRIRMNKAIGERGVYPYTHAFFPKWAFDEIAESNGWIFGRRGAGFVALYSARPYEWKDPDSPAVHDAVAKGKQNVWICLTGDTDQYGSFDAFKQQVLAARVDMQPKDLAVTFDAPGVGTAKFSWKGSFVIDGKEQALNNFPRVDNPYCRSEFDSGVYVIEHGGERLTLDFPDLLRKTEKVN